MKIKKADRLQGTDEYYFSRKLEEIRELKNRGANIINLGIGSPDMMPSPATITAAQLALENSQNHSYAPYRSSLELRIALADWYLKTYQVKLNASDEILPLLGSKEGILYTSLAFLNPGDGVLIPNPGYPAYRSVAKLTGAHVLDYNLSVESAWFPDFREIEKLDLTKVKMMWVNYPHMPTGKAPSKKLFEDLILFGRKHEILICHDNPYSLVLNNDTPLSILEFDEQKKYSLELNSFSKAFNMAGWRVGAVCGSKEIIDSILQVKSNVDSGMFAVVQAGAMAALNNSNAWHEERNKEYSERRNLVYKIFDTLGFSYSPDQVGLFVWAKASEGVPDVLTFIDLLLKETEIFLTPGSVFGSQGSRYVRSSLCASKEILNEALSRVVKWKEAKSQ